MKKRITAFLLILIMAVSMLAAAGVSASADDTVTVVTVKQGDTLYSMCRTLGYSFERFKDVIMRLNNFTDEKQLTGIREGQQIALPTNGVTAEAYLNAYKADQSSLKSVMVAGIPVGDSVMTVTVEKGDTLYSLCSKLGYGYKTYTELLMKLNELTDESKLTNLKVGDTLIMPVSLEAADALCEALNIKKPESKVDTKSAEKQFVAGNIEKVAVGDRSLYYLTEYTVQKNDNIKNLITLWGLRFEDVSQLILTLNSMSDFNHIATGRTLILPTNMVSTQGTYYTVIERTAKSGETAYSIVNGFGMDYSKALPTLEKLNPGVDFAKLKAGQKLNIPVLGIAPAGEIRSEIKAQWKIDFETTLYNLYGATVDHYEDLGNNYYRVYVLYEGKVVPYVTINSVTGEYHG